MKALILFALFALALPVGAQTIIPANAIKLDWDPVTTIEDGSALPPGDTISYELFQGIDASIAAAVLDGETSAPPYTMVFASEGVYVVGVRTVRLVEATGERRESSINWSNVDVPAGATPDPFYVSVFLAPATPVGFRATLP